MNKKYYLICLMALLGCMLAMPGRVMAQSEKAILCQGARTLYFVYDNNTYAPNGYYTDDDGVQRLITTVTTGFLSTTYSVNNRNKWGSSTSIYYIDFQNSFKLCKPTSLRYWFDQLGSLEEVKHSSNLDLSNALDL